MAKKFVRTTKNYWNSVSDKSLYNDSIVFIEDSKEIWSNNVYYSPSEARQIIYKSDIVEYDNVQDMLDYLLDFHKQNDFDESFNMDFGYIEIENNI